ncbi:hypothetical protein ACFV16_22405 [Streptomyces massasporeus]|uniref:hypothetical protein n=1 Tax=Streptomyces massasporeus TaxID=67324 RepID=UPI0036981DE6
MQSTPERKPCGTCGNEYTVTANGTIHHHTTNKPEFQADPTPHTSNKCKCKGAGEPPASPAGVALAEDMEAGQRQCRLCKHPVELTGNGRARSHLTPEQTPRQCPGGSDFPLGDYPDILGTTDGLVATLAADCEHVPVGQCYGCHGVPVPGEVVGTGDSTEPTPESRETITHTGTNEAAVVAAPWGVDPAAVQQPTMADQFTASPITALLERETAGVGTVLDAVDGDPRSEAEQFMGTAVPEQPATGNACARADNTCSGPVQFTRTATARRGAHLCSVHTGRVEHVYTDPSGIEWRHPGLTGECQAPDCVALRSDNPEGFDPNCPKCDTDDHRCPGCGADVPHGVVACNDCSARVDAEKAEQQAKCTHPDGFSGPPLRVDGRDVSTCEHCGAVTPTAALPVGETDDGRPCDHTDELFGVENGKPVCVACGTECTHPTGTYGVVGGDQDRVVGTCTICGSVDDGGGETHVVTDDSDDPEHADDCSGCVTPEPQTGPVRLGELDEGDHFLRNGTLMRLTERESSSSVLAEVVDGPHKGRTGELKNLTEVVQRAPEPQAAQEPESGPVRLGELETGDHFTRRGTLMRVTGETNGVVHAVVVDGPHKGRTGDLPNLGETVERAPAPQTTEQETKECTDSKAAQTSPRSSSVSATRTASPTTAPAPGSKPPTVASAQAVSPKSKSVTPSAPTAKAAGNGRSAAVTTDQSAAAAAFLGTDRPAAPAGAATTPGQFLAGAGGSHGEKETKRDRFGRYLIPHPDTGKEQAWTRATTFAKSISDTYALSQWGLRMALLGATKRSDLVARAHGKHVSADKKLLDELTAELKNAAGDKVAANHGTNVHSFTEMADRAWHSPGGPRSVLDQVPPDYRDMVETYIRLLEETGLEPVPHLIEFTTVVKQYKVAGTSDNCYKVTKPLTLKVGRGEVRLEPGQYVIGDKKTGRDLSYGWQEIAIQLGIYAQGLNTAGVWDRENETWEPDPLSRFDKPGTKVRLDAGIVVHLPLDRDGEKQPTVYGIDLESGWNAAVLCERVRAWRNVRTLASPAMVSEGETFSPVRAAPAVTSRTTVRPPTLLDKANAVTSKGEAAAIWQEATDAGLPRAEVDRLVDVMQSRLRELTEPGG